MAQKNNLFWDENFSPSRSNVVLANVTLIDPGMLGFDVDLQAFRRLIGEKNLERVKRVVVSHGHFDQWNHIGLFAEKPQTPVYMGLLTQALVWRSAEFDGSMELEEIAERAVIIKPGDIVEDEIETFFLPHSIPQTMGIVLPGKQGLFVHLGDFRLKDFKEEEQEKTLVRLREIGERGVDTVAFSIFNAHIPGFTPVEQLAIDEIARILAEAPGKVVITCFSTNFGRILAICRKAEQLERPVRFFGSAMRHTQEILGVGTVKGDRARAVYLVTGCQAEPGSALDILANEVASGSRLAAGNTLVFSSRCIPGNEPELGQMIRKLRPGFARVIVNRGDIEQVGLRGLDVEEALTHVSGHEYGAGIRAVLEALRPKKVLAWPQTSPQIEAFRGICEEVGGIEILDESQRVIGV